MRNISKETLAHLRAVYPAGARVELISMDDPYNTQLMPGVKGTVVSVTIWARFMCSGIAGHHSV